MTTQRRGAMSLDAVEARNALTAEAFRKLPDDIPLWRFREVLTKLGGELGLSAGAALYAMDLMGLLTEADWRGDGRAVTFHSIRTYARKVGKSERTICEYERQLIAAGLVHRTIKHARRHGGQGDENRRTGLDWRAFGAAMPTLLNRLEERHMIEQRRLDIEARIRSTRRIVLGLIETLEEGRAIAARATFTALGITRLRSTCPLQELESSLGRLLTLQTSLIAETPDLVDNVPYSPQEANQSEEIDRLIDDTDYYSSPKEICKQSLPQKHSDSQKTTALSIHNNCLENDSKDAQGKTRPKGFPISKIQPINAIPIDKLWKAAPTHWKQALGTDIAISWPILTDLARHLAPKLDISPFAWNKALQTLGAKDTALALLILDCNRNHPKLPVKSIGGALVGMTRRAEEGDFNLAPSAYGVIARYEQRNAMNHALNSPEIEERRTI